MNEATNWVTDVVTGGTAVALIYVVILFLKHLKEERVSRDEAQREFLSTIKELSTPITELTTEVKLLRQEHRKEKTA